MWTTQEAAAFDDDPDEVPVLVEDDVVADVEGEGFEEPDELSDDLASVDAAFLVSERLSVR